MLIICLNNETEYIINKLQNIIKAHIRINLYINI